MANAPAPQVDTSRAPTGEITARALVEAIVAHDDRIERHYLEAKSNLDLTTKRDQAKLAKFILGAANRMPDKASRAFSGHAVMVIGASKGRFAGIPPIEALEIEKAVLPYLGADGPKWELLRVPAPAGQNEVLLVIVDPPEAGQGPFICHKEGEGLLNGTVYVRADGETRQARADELKALIRRDAATAPAADFEVTIMGHVVRATLDQEAALEEYVNATRGRLLSAMPQSPSGASRQFPTFGAALLSGAGGILEGRPETRSREDYLGAIDAWERSVRDSWSDVVQHFVAQSTHPVEVRLINRERTFFQDLELQIHLEGDVRGVECGQLEDDTAFGDLPIPSPPRAWGPTVPDLTVAVPYYATPHLPLLPNRVHWDNSGSVRITFDVGDLRPMETDVCGDGDLALLLPADTDEHEVRGTWEITARGHHTVYSGDTEVPVVDRDLSSEFRRALGLEDFE